jgi:Raf kinase inhibitor-like YbhB/YbcL family protein
MLRHNRLLFIFGLIIVASAIFIGVHYFFRNEGRTVMSDGTTTDGLQISSPAFKDGEAIPEQYTCRGQNINPPLNVTGQPEGTKSMALILHDPDAVNGDFLHWLVWDLPAGTQAIGANSVPVGAIQGLNGTGNNNYMGPCPPDGTGTHHYKFDLYALDITLGLDAKSTRQQLTDAVKGHILAQTTLTGLFSAAR